MKILFLGDVMGCSGREAVCHELPNLRKRLCLDFVVVNGENAAGGFGITEKICQQFHAAGTDVITTGNHVWGQREIIPYISKDRRLLRPQNFPAGTPGRGIGVFETELGKKVLVLHVMTRLFMDALDDPFACIKTELAKYPLGGTVDAAIIDVHGEATSEKMALAHLADGHVSMVVGSHTHIPTADAHVLAGGTAYQTDAGMCGDYDSVIGMAKDEPMRRFVRKMSGGRPEPAAGPATVCGLFVETDDRTGLALRAEPVRVGGRLSQTLPACVI